MQPDWFEVLGQIVDPLVLLDAEGKVLAASPGSIEAFGRGLSGKFSALTTDPAAFDALVDEARSKRAFVRGSFQPTRSPNRRYIAVLRRDGPDSAPTVLICFWPAHEGTRPERFSAGLGDLLEIEMKRLAAIERLSTSAAHSESIEEITGIALSELVLSAGAVAAEIYVADERGLPRMRGSSGPAAGEFSPDRVPEPGSLLERALQLGKPLWMLVPEGGSEGAIPLFSARRMVGGLALTFAQERVHDPSVERFVSTIASHLGPALDRALLLASERRARERAEAAERRKDELLAIVGQELEAPLAALRAAVERMTAGGARERYGKELRVLEEEGRHVSRTVDHLVDFSSLTSGTLHLARQRVEVGALIARALELSSPAIDRRAHRLVVEVPPGLWVDADPTRMAQVFAQLIGNAAKFTPEKGKITVSAALDGPRISIAVRDNGPGIPRELQEGLFDRPLAAERAGAGGLGLGLWIASRVVGLHGGELTARSDGAGHGSTFVVRLEAAPAVEEKPVPEPARAPAEPPSDVRGQRILVVDDNEITAHLVSLALERAGYVVRPARDGPTALRVAEHFAPDLVVLDIALPGMDGYELAERLRRTPALEGVKVVGLSGYGHDLDRARAMRAGFHAYLAKPIDDARLLRTIKAVLEEAAS